MLPIASNEKKDVSLNRNSFFKYRELEPFWVLSLNQNTKQRQMNDIDKKNNRISKLIFIWYSIYKVVILLLEKIYLKTIANKRLVG